MKKKFKETKFGKLVTEKLPDVASMIGDVLPDNGVFGIVKNAIDMATISKEEKEELHKEASVFEATELKMILEDKQNARSREVELAKTGTTDYLMLATGGAVIIGFLFSVVAIIFFEVPKNNKEIFIHLLGMLEGAFVGGMVFYYFGASKAQ
jgi:hypothetical protein